MRIPPAILLAATAVSISSPFAAVSAPMTLRGEEQEAGSLAPENGSQSKQETLRA